MKRNYTEQKGITLVALIITIIVLLILAVVAIGAVQNDGIIDYAKNARTEYQAAQTNETTQLQSYLDKITENAPNPVFSSITANNYGDTIEYSVGNVNEWKVFYKDATHLYIITSDYLEKAKIPTGLLQNILGNGSPYDVFLDHPIATKASSTITTAIANKYKLSWFSDTTKESTNLNARATAALLDTTVWTAKFGNAEKGIEAIGAPTLEMWVASWNAKGTVKNTAETTKYVALTPTVDSATGYKINGSYIINVGTTTDGYADTLYFPNTSKIDGCDGYWLSSPAASGPNNIFGVVYNGSFCNEDVTGGVDYFCSTRPIVSIPSSAVTKNADGSLKVAQ